MPDPATWLLTLAAPGAAASVALQINRTRISHELRMRQRDDTRRVLEESAEALTAATHGLHIRPEDDDTGEAAIKSEFRALGVTKARLLLTFPADHAVVVAWQEMTKTASLIAAVEMSRATGKSVTITGEGDTNVAVPDATRLRELRSELYDHSVHWLEASRHHLETLSE